MLGIPLKYTLQRLGDSPLPKRRPQKTQSDERKNKIVSHFTALASSGGEERLVHGFGAALAPGGSGEVSAGVQTPCLPHTWGFARVCPDAREQENSPCNLEISQKQYGGPVISWRLCPHWEAGETRGVRAGNRRGRGKFLLVAWLGEEQEEVCTAGAVKAEEAGGEGAVLSHPSLPPKKNVPLQALRWEMGLLRSR